MVTRGPAWQLIPGILLLALIGFAGKVTEQAINSYGRTHQLVLPNIEYVLWAILFGLIVSNTVGVPAICRRGVETYEFWLKVGIVLLGVRFLLGDIVKLGGVSLVCVVLELIAGDCDHDGARPRVRLAAEADQPARDWIGDLRRVRDHRREGRDRSRR